MRSKVVGRDAECERRFAKRGALIVGLVSDRGGLVVSDVGLSAVTSISDQPT
jgi:hypothetical protein